MNPPTPTDTGQGVRDGNERITNIHTAVASTHDAHSTLHSAPPTPRLQTPLARRRTSQPATSPIMPSPRQPHPPLRRTSSSTTLNKSSSPQVTRRGSRTSLGGTYEEQERRPTPKRSISNLISGLREAKSAMEPIEEPVPLTATQIATDHFTRELLGHSQPGADAEAVVILHDACYGHRYSRLKATKTSLSLIVERPERIHASILGASTAYVRLGGHHAGGKRSPHPERTQASSPPFKIRRSGRSLDITSSFVTNVHGTSWMSELQGLCHSAPEKLAAGVKELSRTSLPGEPEKQMLHEGDLYLAPESLNAFQGALGGVADAVDTVFDLGSNTKRAFVAVRPPGHHCSADLPSGFCWLNNVHVGIEYAAQMYGLTHAAILDFDLHHGDGSQAITWERNSKNNEKRLNAKPNSKLRLGPDIGYYSIHDINSYPCEMGDDEKVQAASLCIENAHGQSIWNVHLQPWKTEDEFWQLYSERYSVLLEKARNFLEHHDKRLRQEGKVPPKSAIFISAGFDASEWEGAGMQRHKVSVPTDFYARFTQDVVKIAQITGSCEGRVISVLEGGYSDRALCSGVLSHLSGLCVSPITPKTNGVGALLEQMSGLSIGGLGIDQTLSYDKEWWSAANLTALEHKVNPPPPAQAKKGRTGPQPTYATPTESFAYKVIDPQKFARSISGTMREGQVPVRPPTPPPPEVDWVVATQELSKLLIPTDRQTKSCTAEELAVARPKKERQSATPTISAEQAGQPRQLRDRKAKAPTYAESAHSDEMGSVRAVSRAESRSSRRETIDVLPSEAPAPAPQRKFSRRLSAGGALSSGSSVMDANAPPVPAMPPTGKRTYTNASAMNPPPVPMPNTQLNSQKIRAPSKPRKAVDASTTTASQANTGSSASSSAAPKSSDIDSLTTGMKKVTLKVSTTKEEHDRKQKEKLDAERRVRALKGAETRRINAAAKKASVKEAPTQTAQSQKPSAPAVVPSSALVEPNRVPASSIQTVEDPSVVYQSHPTPFDGNDDVVTMSGCASDMTLFTNPETNAGGVATTFTEQYSGPRTSAQTVVSPIVEAPASLATAIEDLEFPEYTNGGGSGSVSPALQAEGIRPNHRTSSAETGASTATSSSPTLPPSMPDVSSPFSASWGKQIPGIPDQQSTHDFDYAHTVLSGQEAAGKAHPVVAGKLPVWSSTGYIPFGTTPAPTGQHVEPSNVWEVPDSPAK